MKIQNRFLKNLPYTTVKNKDEEKHIARKEGLITYFKGLCATKESTDIPHVYIVE
jgi:hypothetical protein